MAEFNGSYPTGNLPGAPMQPKRPDIRFFQSYKHRRNLLAKFEYMGVPPTLKALEAQLILYEMIQSHGVRLTRGDLERGQRAFLAIRNGDYVTDAYPWQDSPTDCWLTTSETVWDDFLKQTNKRKNGSGGRLISEMV